MRTPRLVAALGLGCTLVAACGSGESDTTPATVSGAVGGAAGASGSVAAGSAGEGGSISSAGFPGSAGDGGVGGAPKGGSAGVAGQTAGGKAGAGGTSGSAGVAGAAGGAGAGGSAPLVCGKAKPSGAVETAHVPAEFIARSYVEAFGRLPDQGGWDYHVAYFQKNGCSADTLRTVSDFYKSNEFLSKDLTTSERTLALARGVLLHDPSAFHLLHAADVIAKGGPEAWCDLVDEYEESQTYLDHAKIICDPSNHNFHFEADAPPIALDGEWTEGGLQAKLDAAAPGAVVEIPQGKLVKVTKGVTVPAGVTLRTAGMTGLSGRQLYPRLARLARTAPFKKAVVTVAAGATLEHVWVDGRRRDFLQADERVLGENVRTEPTNTKPSLVRWVRSDNPSGPQNIRIASSPGDECGADVTVEENLVVNFSNDNHPSAQSLWADGIFAHCERSRVTSNEVLDPSDVALIMFVSENGKQRSTISKNRVLSAGNDAFGGLVVDTWTGFRCDFKPCDFSGASFEDNILFSGPNTRFVFGVSTSSAPWKFIGAHGSANGAKFLHTTSGTSRVRLQIALYAAHMTNAEVAGNWDAKLIDFVDDAGSEPPNACGKGASIREAATTSGSIQATSPGTLTDCIQ